MVSGSGVENPPNGHDVFEVYLRAKAAAFLVGVSGVQLTQV
jgi:hypothetical protein